MYVTDAWFYFRSLHTDLVLLPLYLIEPWQSPPIPLNTSSIQLFASVPYLDAGALGGCFCLLKHVKFLRVHVHVQVHVHVRRQIRVWC